MRKKKDFLDKCMSYVDKIFYNAVLFLNWSTIFLLFIAQRKTGKQEKPLDKWVRKQWWRCPQKRLPTTGHVFSCHNLIHGRSGECYLNPVSSDQDSAQQSTGQRQPLKQRITQPQWENAEAVVF